MLSLCREEVLTPRLLSAMDGFLKWMGSDYPNIYRHNVQVFQVGHVTPGTLIANTDTKHYLNLTNNIYR